MSCIQYFIKHFMVPTPDRRRGSPKLRTEERGQGDRETGRGDMYAIMLFLFAYANRMPSSSATFLPRITLRLTVDCAIPNSRTTSISVNPSTSTSQ